jgi:TetR/AcrR family transcriptional regulator, regulator of autoinduction and epiphytic fitness
MPEARLCDADRDSGHSLFPPTPGADGSLIDGLIACRWSPVGTKQPLTDGTSNLQMNKCVTGRISVFRLARNVGNCSTMSTMVSNTLTTAGRRQVLAEEILYLAQLLIAESGYDALSMDNLANRCGISKPTLYSLFGSKEGLAIAAVLQALATMSDLLALRIDGLSALDHLQLVVRWALQLQPTGGTLITQLWSTRIPTQIRAHAEVRAACARVDSAVLRWIRAGIAQGEIASDVYVEAIALLFYTMIGGLNEANRSLHDTCDSSTMIEMFVRLFARSVCTPGALTTYTPQRGGGNQGVDDARAPGMEVREPAVPERSLSVGEASAFPHLKR